MSPNDKPLKRKRRIVEDDSSSESTISISMWFILGMVVVAVVCLIIGFIRHGMDWKTVLAALGSLVTGIAFVTIGLLELEWLERIDGFVDGIVSGISQWFWTTQMGTLSDQDLVGRSGATVIWVLLGIPFFIWGCLLALRVFEI